MIQCLLDVQDQLFENMHTDPRRFDYRQEAKRLSDEMLEQKELMPDNRAHSLLTFEQKKAEFFAEQCGGMNLTTGQIPYISKIGMRRSINEKNPCI